MLCAGICMTTSKGVSRAGMSHAIGNVVFKLVQTAANVTEHASQRHPWLVSGTEDAGAKQDAANSPGTSIDVRTACARRCQPPRSPSPGPPLLIPHCLVYLRRTAAVLSSGRHIGRLRQTIAGVLHWWNCGVGWAIGAVGRHGAVLPVARARFVGRLRAPPRTEVGAGQVPHRTVER